MKKLMIAVLGLSLLSGSSLMFGQDTPPPTKKEKKQKKVKKVKVKKEKKPKKDASKM